LPVAREDEPRRAPVAVRGARIRPAVDAPDTGLDTLASIQRAQPPTSEGDDSASGKTASEPEPGAKANLGINSIPASKISLDGRPLGHTPRLGVSVDAGQHVVVFDHPEHGQRSVTVTVKPGQSRVVSVRF
jgi:serine/threonine-protein kinase